MREEYTREYTREYSLKTIPTEMIRKRYQEKEIEFKSVSLGDREPVFNLLKDLFQSQESIRADQTELLRIASMQADRAATKEQISELIEVNHKLEYELQRVRRFVETLSVRTQFRRLSLFAVCAATLLVILTIAGGGELILRLKFSAFLLFACILLFVISSLAPNDDKFESLNE